MGPFTFNHGERRLTRDGDIVPWSYFRLQVRRIGFKHPSLADIVLCNPPQLENGIRQICRDRPRRGLVALDQPKAGPYLPED